MTKILCPALLALSLVGCNKTADYLEQQKQEIVQSEAVRQAGTPAITNFTERKFLKMLYELRDQQGYKTYTYTIDMNNKRRLLCESIGYGIPYATQFSNPQKRMADAAGNLTNSIIAQAEPNALFSPSHADGTWIMALTKDGVKPIFCEPHIIVSPFKLDEP